jgi:GSCFA family protein
VTRSRTFWAGVLTVPGVLGLLTMSEPAAAEPHRPRGAPAPAKRRSEKFWTGQHWNKRRSWHQDPNVFRYPDDRSRFETDLPRLIREDVLPGHTPPHPLLDGDDKVVTMGSCFARELRDHLTRRGAESGNIWIPSGLNNTFAILDFVSWCVTGSDAGAGYRYDRDESGEIGEWLPEETRERYEQRLAEAGAFVFTFGLAEVWQDRETKGVFWRGIPQEVFDEKRHEFRLSTVDENEENIVRLIELIRTVNPDAPIVLTLSPVPLLATFRGRSCITADAVSKSALRMAIDAVESRGLHRVYYWPSFEIVRWVGGHLPYPAFGVPDRRARHVSRYLVDEIIDAFVETFYTPAAVEGLRARREPAPTSVAGRIQDAAYPLVMRSQAAAARLERPLRRMRKRVRRRRDQVRGKVIALRRDPPK